ncbi:MAG: hypothetical protein ACRETM_13405 [Stenotrophobium sp.]
MAIEQKDRAGLRCDRCSLPFDKYDFEFQEAVIFRFPVLNSKANEAPWLIQSTLCQHCVKECFGKYLEVRWIADWLIKCPKTQPLWAWQSYQLEQGWKDAQALLSARDSTGN